MTERSLSTYIRDGRLAIYAPKTKATVERHLQIAFLFALDSIKWAASSKTAEKRFLFAHNAACAFVETALLLKGYRLTREGDIDTVLEVMPLVMGDEFDDFHRYFSLRKQRRKMDRYMLYSSAPGVTFSEADELLNRVRVFQEHAMAWLADNGWWEVMG